MRNLGAVRSRFSVKSRRLLLILSGIALLGAVVLALWFIPTPYYITAPGAAIDTSRLVSVPGGTPRPGHLYMLVLNTDRANLFWYLEAKLDRRSQLETEKEFLGGIQDYDKWVQMSRQLMFDSEKTAKAIALYQTGFGQGVRALGVEVVDLLTESPATGLLQKGDVIVWAAGKPIRTSEELTSLLGQIQPGSTVDLRVRRANQEVSLSVPTSESTDPARAGSAALGIYIHDSLEFDLPIDVEIKPGAITGPSAGLMFTLQIIDQLTPGGITGDRIIAGTGTIEPDGRVGVIGGVQQKVHTAQAAGAMVMFVPRGNYEEAKQVATRIELVPVDTYKDALLWLELHKWD